MRTALAGVVLLSSTLARAATIIVPDQHPTIQAAIDASVPGDTIQVRPGTYAEALEIKDKSIVIEGLGGRPTIAPGPTATGVRVREAVFDVVFVLREVDIIGARIGVQARVYSLHFEQVGIAGGTKGALLKSTGLTLIDTNISGNDVLGLRAAAAGVALIRFTATGNDGIAAKIKNLSRDGVASMGNVEDSVFSDNGKGGLVYLDRHNSWIRGCDASHNSGPGFTVTNKGNGVVLTDNQANSNATYGFHTRGILQSETDLINDGNVASGNGVQDFLVE